MSTPSTVTHTLQLAAQRLAAAGCDTPRLDAEILLAHTLAQPRTRLYVYPAQKLTAMQQARFEQWLARRAQREPVAYIIGEKAFYGLEFLVTPAVLIPRPETELLVENALELLANRPAAATATTATIAEAGTGSGCIAIALAHHQPAVRLQATDLSAEALAVAAQNAARLGVTEQIEFFQGDLLSPLTEPVDLIVSNPPYVSQTYLVAPETQPEVSRYEPRLALDGGPDGLAIIRRLLAQTADKLRPGGSLLVEIGADQGQAVQKLAHSHFPQAKIYIKQDLAGRDRLLIVERITKLVE